MPKVESTFHLFVEEFYPIFLVLPKESQKVKFGFPSIGKSGQLRNKKCQLSVPWSSQEWQTFPSNFSLQRNSVPNIYSTAPGSGSSLRKRHSFQEGVQYFQDKVG